MRNDQLTTLAISSISVTHISFGDLSDCITACNVSHIMYVEKMAKPHVRVSQMSPPSGENIRCIKAGSVQQDVRSHQKAGG